MKNPVNKRLRIFLIVIAGMVLIIFGSMIYTLIEDDGTTSHAPLPEYHNLFNKEAQSKLTLLVTTKGNNRGTSSSYVYDRRFNIFVYKVVLKNKIDLTKIIQYKNGSSSNSNFVIYSGLPSFNFDMKINSGKVDVVSAVELKIEGSSINSVIDNDSLRCYYYKFKTFSINFNDVPYDILALADEPNIPASIIFKRKGKFLYVVLMTVREGKEEMQPDLLYRLINK